MRASEFVALPGMAAPSPASTARRPLPGLAVEPVRDWRRWEQLEAPWEDLLAASGVADHFLGHAWLTAWMRAARARPHVLLVWRGVRLVGAAPLVLTRELVRGLPRRRLQFAACGPSDYQSFIAAETPGSVLRACANALVATRAAWDLLDLDELDGRDPNLPLLLQALAAAGCTLRATAASPCALLPVQGRWEDFYANRVSGQRRKKYRKAAGRLAALGKVRVDLIERIAPDDHLFDELAELERAHPRAGAERPGMFNLAGACLRALLPVLARRGEVLLPVLRLDGQPLAYLLFWLRHGRASAWATAYRASVAGCSPGSLLMCDALGALWARGVTEIDFNRGVQSYKEGWVSTRRDNLRVRAWHRGWRSQAWFLARRSPA